MNISKHAYRRARQRLGLNRKAFNRMVESGKSPIYVELVIKNDVIVTVKNNMKCDMLSNNRINKNEKNKLVIYNEGV